MIQILQFSLILDELIDETCFFAYVYTISSQNNVINRMQIVIYYITQ